MAKSYLTNIHTRKIVAKNVIFHNLYACQNMYNKKNMSKNKPYGDLIQKNLKAH